MILFSLSLGSCGFFLGSVSPNYLDRGGASHVGILYAVGNTIGNLSGILSPMVTGMQLGDGPTRLQWLHVFSTAAIVNVSASVIYLVCASTKPLFQDQNFS